MTEGVLSIADGSTSRGDLNLDDVGGSAFRLWREALDRASTIEVLPGRIPNAGAVVAKRPVVIRGPASALVGGEFLLHPRSRMEGLAIEVPENGVGVELMDRCTVRDVRFLSENASSTCVRAQGVKRPRVLGCDFEEATADVLVDLVDCKYGEVRSCSAERASFASGIRSFSSGHEEHHLTIADNEFEECIVGAGGAFDLEGFRFSVLRGNRVGRCLAAAGPIFNLRSGVHRGNSNAVGDNVVHNSGGAGAIFHVDVDDSSLVANVVVLPQGQVLAELGTGIAKAGNVGFP